MFHALFLSLCCLMGYANSNPILHHQVPLHHDHSELVLRQNIVEPRARNGSHLHDSASTDRYAALTSLKGSYQVVGYSGVPAMSAVLMPNGNAIFLDKVENYTQLTLDNGHYAYSAEFNFTTNTARALSYKTNAFCTAGYFLADGRVISVGGNGPVPNIDPTIGDGFRGIRYFGNGHNEKGWDEPGHLLSTARWYASVQMMQDKTLFVVSGSLNGLEPTKFENNNPTFEILDETGVSISESIILPILERNQPYYMYPFLHLLKDGNVFIFVSRSAEIYDVQGQVTVKTLPDLPGAHRTYPNTGGSVLLPLANDKSWEPEIMVCGGGEYPGIESPADPTCGRIQPLSANPVWEIENMPEERLMVEGILLPDGTVTWLNGARQGAQGFGTAKDPCFDTLIYDPDQPSGSRWTRAGTSNIPRLYHSVALLLLDGTIMIAGSNPMELPLLEADPSRPETAYATEFRVEIFTPPYLSGDKALERPQDIWISQYNLTADGSHFVIGFTGTESAQSLKIALYHGGFATHSVHMGQRLLFLDFENFFPGSRNQVVDVTMPPSSSIAPPGPYVIYVVLDGVPGVGQFVMVQ